MNKNHERVIALLEGADTPLSSMRLTELMGVSARSVKSYIRQINSAKPGRIRSTHRGYLLEQGARPSQVAPDDVPQTYAERSQRIIHRLLIENAESVDIYELCDELCLSYSSVKGLIGRMNQEYRGLRVVFRCRADRVCLEGAERDKRRFLTRAIYRESSGYFVDRNAIKELFGEHTINTIDEVLQGVACEHGLSASEFGYANLLLHLAISVDRVRSGNALAISDGLGPVELQRDTIEIIDGLQARFGIVFDEMERRALDEQVRTNLLAHSMSETERIIADIGEDNYRITAQVIDAVNGRYHLRLNHETLQLPLALHVKNLVTRCRRGTVLPNPFLETMQVSCPVLFDCAVFVAEIIQKEFDIEIPNDEVAYLAMHIGADIERQNRDDGKLSCVLLCPDYYGMRDELVAHLLNHLGQQIALTAVCGHEDEIPDTPFDVLISTVNPSRAYRNVIVIPPFKTAVNMKELVGRLQDIADQCKLRSIASSYRTFFQPDLFRVFGGASERRNEVIRTLTGLLMKYGYVSEGFLQDVMRREEAASTAFRDVAVPHAMNMSAHRTGIAVAVAPDGIAWGDRYVHVVLLIAIEEHDLPVFQELYEALILLFSREEFVTAVRQCASFETFEQLLFMYSQ